MTIEMVVVVFILMFSILLSILLCRDMQIDRFQESDSCSSIVAVDFESNQIQTQSNQIQILAAPTNQNARLETIPSKYARPQTTTYLPNSYTDWYLSSRSADIKMTDVQGDFVALLYGPNASPPANITDYVSYYDYIIFTLYISALGLKLSSPDLKVTVYLTRSGQVAPDDVKNATAYGALGSNKIFMTMPTSKEIGKYPESWQQTIGHELFHVFSTFTDQTDIETHGVSESLANFFGWLSVSMYNGKHGADLVSHGSFSCYNKFDMPLDITYMSGGYGYNLGGLQKASCWMYGAWHIWYFWYKEFGIDSLVKFLNRTNKRRPIVFAEYFGNNPLGSPDFVASKDAGTLCPAANTAAWGENAGLSAPTCKTGLLRDVDATVLDLHDFLSTFVARTMTNAYFNDDFTSHYKMATATSGTLYWAGFVAMNFKTTARTAKFDLTPKPEDWRIVLCEYDGTKWLSTIYPGTIASVSITILKPLKLARLAIVAAYDNPMLPGVDVSWSVVWS